MLPRKEIYGILAILVLTIVGACAYLGSVRDTSKAEQVREDVSKEIFNLRNDLKISLAKIEQDRKEVKTPAQIAQAIPRYTEGVRPIIVVPGGVPTNLSDVGGNIPSISLPDAPSAIQSGSLIIPRDEVPAYWKSVTACAENTAKLGACEKTVPLLTQRAEAAEKAMHGGSFWSKTKKAVIYLGIGAAAGYALKH